MGTRITYQVSHKACRVGAFTITFGILSYYSTKSNKLSTIGWYHSTKSNKLSIISWFQDLNVKI